MRIIFSIVSLFVLLFSMVSFLLPEPVQAVGDRYFVMGQIVVEDGSDGHIAVSPTRVVADGNITVGTAGNLHVYMASGTTGHIDSGTCTITGSPVTLTAGLNDITAEGVGDFAVDITIGTAANWSSHNSWSATSGGACTATEPDSGLDANFDANSFTAASQVVTVDATANCLNMDWTGATNTPTLSWPAANSIYVYGNVTFIAAMTISGAVSNAALYFYKTGTCQLTTNTVSVNVPIGVTSGCTLSLQDNLTQAGGTMCGIYLRVTTAVLTTNNYNITNAYIYGGYSGQSPTVNLGSSTITVSVSTGWDFNQGIVLAANTATINVSGTGAFAGGGATTYNNVNLNGTAHTISGSNTFVNLTRNGTATKTDTLTLTSGTTQTVTGTCALIGNSAINRLLVQSSTLGSAATLHVTTDVAANWTGTNAVDFMDITSTHAVDLSAAGLNPAAYSGDCGGNTGFTFTTSAAQTSGSTATWSTAAKWTSRVPLPQDDVTCSHNTTVDMPRLGRSITITGSPAMTYSVDNSLYGSLTLSATQSGNWFSGGLALLLRGRTAGLTLRTNGNSLYYLGVSSPTGTYTLQDNLAITSRLLLSAGTLVDNGFTITMTNTSGFGNKWQVAGGTATLTGTLIMTNSGTNAQTFAGGGLSYNNVTVQGAGNYALTITGNNTFNTFTVDRSAAAKTITLTASSNQTVNNFISNEYGTNALTINSTGAAAVLHKTGGGGVGMDYLNLSNNIGSPVNTWYYQVNSTIGANVTGWSAPSTIPAVTTNAATNTEETTSTFNGQVTDVFYANNITEEGFEYDTDSGAPYAFNKHTHGGWKVNTFLENITSLTKGELYYFRSYGTNVVGTGYGLESTTLTKPDEPNTFTTTTVNSTVITCNWVKGTGALNTLIMYKSGSYPVGLADGTLGYNGTGTTFTQGGLTDATQYYFRGWSWASEGGLFTYSDMYAGNTTLTSGPPQVSSVAASSVEENTATTTGVVTYSPSNTTVWGTQYGLASTYGSWSNVTGIALPLPYVFGNNLVGLSEGSLYYYRAFAQNMVGVGYGTQLTFLTKPDPPTALSVATSPAGSTLTWVKGSGALNTVIYGKDGSYPSALGDGTLVYNGTASSTSYMPTFSVQRYYYRAWSWASNLTWNKYSDTYSEINAQGRMSDFVRLLVCVVFIAVMVMGLIAVIMVVKQSFIALMFALVSFALIGFMGVAVINALL